MRSIFSSLGARDLPVFMLLTAALTGCPSNESTTVDEPTTQPATASTSTPTSSSGEPDTDTDTDTDEPIALCPEHTAADACCCFEAHVNLSSSVENVCPTEVLCPPAEFECAELDPTCITADEVPVNCVLDALVAADKVGMLTVHYVGGGPGGQRKIDLYMQPGRTAFVADKTELDASGYFKPLGLYTLRDAAFFEACRAETDVQAKADCLQDLVVGEASEVCIDGFNYET